MSQKFFFLLLVTLLFSCVSPSKHSEDVASHTPKNIKGVWNLKSREPMEVNPDGINEDADPEELFNTLEINDSTISFYRYPFEHLFTYPYTRNGNEILVKGLFKNYRLELEDTWLLITEKYTNGNYLRYNHHYNRSRGNYNQDTVEMNLLRALKRDTINYHHLLGKWRLSTERNPNDGSDIIKLEFPFAIPHQLTFPNQKMDTTISKQIISLNVKGKKMPFVMTILDRYSFRLFPWHWELDGPEMIYYRE